MATDDFNRGYATTLGANWDVLAGSLGTTSTNQASGGTNGVDNLACYNALTAGDDQTSYMIAIGPTGGVVGVGVRMTSTDWYIYLAAVTGSGSLYKKVSGSVSLVSNIADTVSSLTEMGISVVGSLVTCYLDRVSVFSQTDTGVPGGGKPGILLNSDTAIGDAWEGSTAAGSGGGGAVAGSLLLMGCGS